MSLMMLNVADIRTDGGTQPPDRLDQGAVAEYAEAMKAGREFDAIEVVFQPEAKAYWLAHGFHRLAAAKLIGVTEIGANVTEGTIADAIHIATSANATNGVRRSIADKRWAVEQALKLDAANGQERSDRAIADHCGVSREFVRTVRAESAAKTEGEPEQDGKTRKGRDGKSYKAGKGKKGKAKPGEVDESIPEEPQWEDGNEGIEVKDADGQVVPERLHEIFTTGRKAFIGWMKCTSDLKSAVLETAETQLGTFIRKQQFEKDCLNIFEALKFACPHAVCPCCQGTGEIAEGQECEACKGLGWVNRSRWDSVKKHKKKAS